jgi:exodeoxyribonuclease VII small subunit
MTAQKKYKDYETAIERLEEITELLEGGEATLEKAIELYTEGLDIARFCSDKLNEAEKKIKLITEKNGLTVESDFDESDEDEE